MPISSTDRESIASVKIRATRNCPISKENDLGNWWQLMMRQSDDCKMMRAMLHSKQNPIEGWIVEGGILTIETTCVCLFFQINNMQEP